MALGRAFSYTTFFFIAALAILIFDSYPTLASYDQGPTDQGRFLKEKYEKKSKHTKPVKQKLGKEGKKHDKSKDESAEIENSTEANEISTGHSGETHTNDIVRQLQANDPHPAEIPFLKDISDALIHKAEGLMYVPTFDAIPIPNILNETTVENYKDSISYVLDPMYEVKNKSAYVVLDTVKNITYTMNDFYSQNFPYGTKDAVYNKLNSSMNAFDVMYNEFQDAFKVYMVDFQTHFDNFWTNFTEFLISNHNPLNKTQNLFGKHIPSTSTPIPSTTKPDIHFNHALKDLKYALNSTLYSLFGHKDNMLDKIYNSKTGTTTVAPQTTTPAPDTNTDTSTTPPGFRYSSNLDNQDLEYFNAVAIPTVIQTDILTNPNFPFRSQYNARYTQESDNLLDFFNQQRSTEGGSPIKSFFEQAKPQLEQYFQDFKNSESGSEIMKQFNSTELFNFVDSIMQKNHSKNDHTSPYDVIGDLKHLFEKFLFNKAPTGISQN